MPTKLPARKTRSPVLRARVGSSCECELRPHRTYSAESSKVSFDASERRHMMHRATSSEAHHAHQNGKQECNRVPYSMFRFLNRMSGIGDIAGFSRRDPGGADVTRRAVTAMFCDFINGSFRSAPAPCCRSMCSKTMQIEKISKAQRFSNFLWSKVSNCR